jgi:hypothetical protein
MILSRVKFYPQERIDLEDLATLLSAARTDAKLWTKQFLSGENYIFKGFTVSGTGLKSATVEMDNATFILGNGTEDFSYFVAEDSPDDIIIPDADLVDGVRNYCELKLTYVDGTPITKAFWDPSANGGEGAEFNQQVDTVTDLQCEVVVVQGGFTGNPDRIPLCIIDTDGSGNIKVILDRRPLFYRLGLPTNPSNTFSWASNEEPAYAINLTGGAGTYVAGETVTFSGGATATVVTGGTTDITVRLPSSLSFASGNTLVGGTSGASRTVNTIIESFTGADKDIHDQKTNDSAVKTEIKRLKGTDYWHQVQTGSINGLASFLNSALVGLTVGARWSWSGSALSITDDSGAPANADNLAKLRLLGKSQQLTLTRQDGTGGSASLNIADGEVLFIKIPTSGNRAYSGAGSGSTNFQTVAYSSFQIADDNYWVAIREGSKLYVRGYGELMTGESAEISDPVTQQLLTFIGAVSEADLDPNYSSVAIVTQGISLTGAVGQLDLSLSGHIAATAAHGATGAVMGTTNTQLVQNKKLEDSTTTIVDASDNTKIIKFDAGGTTGTKTTITGAQTADRVVTLPDATDTLVGRQTADQGASRLKNKDLDTANVNVVDPSDTTKKLGWDTSANTTGKKATIASAVTLDRTITLPDATDTLVGKATADTLTNKILAFLKVSVADDGSATGANATLTAFTVGTLRLTNASLTSISGIPAGTTGQVVIIENKTGGTIQINNEEATATAANRIQTGTGSNASMANNTTYMFIYDATNSRWQLIGSTGSGSGSSGINYFTNGTAESDTTGWITYSDNTTFTVTIASPGVFTVGSTTGYYVGMPVYLTTTGALPTGLTTNTTYYISSVVSGTTFKVSATPGGADVNTSGTQSGVHSVYFAAPIDGTGGSPTLTFTRSTSSPLRGTASFLVTKDAANRLGEGASYAITLDAADKYKPLTLTFDYKISSGTYADGDVQLWIYDVTNATLIQPTGYRILNVGVESKHIAEFQASSSTSYRVCYHVASASSSTYTIQMDNIQCGPNAVARGAFLTDWQAFTASSPQGLGTITGTFYWRRNGQNVDIIGRASIGTVTASEARISLPTGLTVDPTLVAQLKPLGKLWRNAAGGYYAYYVTAEPSVTYMTFSADASATETPFLKLVGTNFISSEAIAVQCSIPIQGWGSGALASTDTDTRVCEVEYTGNAGTALTANVTNIDFSTKVRDSHGAFNGTTFTAPLPGSYNISGSITLTAGVASAFSAYVNGSQRAQIGGQASTVTSFHSIAGQVYLNAGDTLTIRTNANATLSNSAISHRLTIHRVAGPAQIMASERVVFEGYLAANQALTSAVTNLTVTATRDSHSAYSSGIFTAPVAGDYGVALSVTQNATTSNYHIYINGVKRQFLVSGNTTTGTGSLDIAYNLLAGDTISIRAETTSTAAGNATPASSGTRVSIFKVGT